jgi:hypothetical protein
VSFGRASAATLAAFALVAAGAPAPPAAAAGTRTLCVDKVTVWDAPGGFAIAYLYRPQTLRVLGTARRRTWSLVRFDAGPRGWIPTTKICK